MRKGELLVFLFFFEFQRCCMPDQPGNRCTQMRTPPLCSPPRRASQAALPLGTIRAGKPLSWTLDSVSHGRVTITGRPQVGYGS
jgi:hypothetical protein